MLRSILFRACLPFLLQGLGAAAIVAVVSFFLGIEYGVIWAAFFVIYVGIRWNSFKKGLMYRINVPLRDIRGKQTTKMALVGESGCELLVKPRKNRR